MAIFPDLTVESIVQTGDRTRLDATKSFVTQDEAAITLVEIQPEAGGDWIAVTEDLFLDWAYSSSGTKAPKVRITTDVSPVTVTTSIEVVTEEEDHLFADDADLLSHESGLYRFLPEGRNSFKDVHRRAQGLILAWLDDQGYRDDDGARLTKAAIVDVQEVKEWATFLALSLIYKGVSNSVEDVFWVKAKSYEALAASARNRASIAVDLDGDGDAEADEGESIAMTSVGVYRR